MLEPNQKTTGTQYTGTAALLIAGFVFSPSALILSHRLDYLSVSIAAAVTLLCVALAWINWRKNSQLTMPSLETPTVRSK